jgi:hypothetical protein
MESIGATEQFEEAAASDDGRKAGARGTGLSEGGRARPLNRFEGTEDWIGLSPRNADSEVSKHTSEGPEKWQTADSYKLYSASYH